VISPTVTVPRPVISPTIPSPRPVAKTFGPFTPEMIKEDTIVEIAMGLDQTNFSNLLKLLSDYYHNDASLVSDKIYDELVDIYEARYGPYVAVGAEPRGEKVELPYYLGSLRKLKKESELNTWIEGHPGPYIVQDKIDGLTLLIASRLVNGRRMTTIYTRGGGTHGLDVSHLVDYIRIPAWLRPSQPQFGTDNPLSQLTNDIAVRGEIVMNKADFNRVGAGFKNARNLVSGIVNSKKSFNPVLARELTFYAYRIMNNNETPERQIFYLQSLGFSVPSPVQSAVLSIDILTNYYESRKKDAPYEADGLVIYQNRAELYPEGEAPRHVVAFKTETESAVTTVIRVDYEASKDWLLKPVVIYDPIELSGATLQRASGYNGRFIVLNNIGPGAKIIVTRSGDVIPKIISVVAPAPGGPAWPDPAVHGVYEWNENQVEFRLKEANDEVITNMFNHFITTLEIKNFGPARAKLLVQHGVKTLTGLLSVRPEQLAAIPGIGPTISTQFYNDLHTKIANVSAPEIMAASGLFPKIGVKRFEMIFEAYPNFLDLARTVPDQIAAYIQNVKGFNELSRVIAEAMPEFLRWLDAHPMIHIGTTLMPSPMPTLTLTMTPQPTMMTPTLTGMSVVFSGFRDKNLEAQVKARNGRVATSVSGNTSMVVMKDIRDVKGKASEALQRGIPLISKEDFINRYLS
jgi:NAD-dependent DNA ligase